MSVNSEVEPNWYHLKFDVSDRFTLVDKDLGNGMHSTTIETDNKGEISDILVYKKKPSFWNRFSVGPTIGVGYDPIRGQFVTNIGIGVTYNILKNK